LFKNSDELSIKALKLKQDAIENTQKVLPYEKYQFNLRAYQLANATSISHAFEHPDHEDEN
jgi:hypothetical protein